MTDPAADRSDGAEYAQVSGKTSLPRLFTNTLALLVAEIVNPLFSVILVIAISRYLGPPGLGQYSFIITYVAIFEPVAKFGFHQIIIRDIAKNSMIVDRYLPIAFFLGTAATLFCVVLMSAIVWLLNYPPEILMAVSLMIPYLFCTTLLAYAFAFLQAFERLQQNALVSSGETFFRMLGSLLLLAFGFQVIGLISLVVVCRAFALLLALAYARRVIGRPHFTIDLSLAKTLFPQAATFCATSLVFILHWRVDLLMLTQMSGLAVAGYYAASYRIFDVCTYLFNSYIAAFYPQQTRAYATSMATFVSSAAKSIKFLSIVSLPLALGFTLIADQVILLLYGRTFEGSILILQVLIWSVVPFAIVRVYSICLVSSLHQTFDFIANLIALLVNVGLNLVLIPRWGAVGASIATLVSICLFAVTQHLFISRRLFRIPLLALVWKPLVATALMGAAVFFFRAAGLYVVIPLAAAIYIALLMALRPFSPDERDAIIELWKSFSGTVLQRLSRI